MKNKKTIIISCIVLVIAAIAAYMLLKGGDTLIIEPKTVTAKKADVTTMVTATGTIEPITQVEVGTQVSGVVEKIYVDYNSVVTAGQLIAELDKTNLKATYSQNKASYDNAVTQKNYLETIYKRQKTLFDNQVISKSDFDDATYNYETAKGTVIERLSDLQKAKTNLSYANIYAPIDGVVLFPSALGITTGSLPSITDTHELVVPKSIPILFDNIVLIDQNNYIKIYI